MAHHKQSPNTNSSKNNLQFIVVDDPNAVKTAGYRKQVRSHVTSHQHRQAREQKREKALISKDINAPTTDEKTKSTASLCINSAQVRSKTKRLKTKRKDTLPAAHAAEDFFQGNPRAVRENSHEEDDSGKSLQQNDGDGIGIAGTAFGRSFSRGTLAFRTFLLQDEDNVLGTCLHHLNMGISSALSCYEHIVKVQSQEFDSLDTMPPRETPNSVIWLRLIFSDPCSLTASLLITISRLTRPRRGLDNRLDYHLMQLRGLLLRTINFAIGDASRAISEAVMVAVALSSAFELEHDPTLRSYCTQMDGLIRMINLRGGLSKIGEENRGAENFYMWHIVNTTEISGCQQYYDAACQTSSLPKRPKADAKRFRMEK